MGKAFLIKLCSIPLTPLACVFKHKYKHRVTCETSFHFPPEEKMDQPQKEAANCSVFYGICLIPYKLVESPVFNQFVALVLSLSRKTSGLRS